MKKTFFIIIFQVLIIANQSLAAGVSTCDALTLYGNAANQGLCKSLSPGSQNLWVCNLTDGSPDIHSTFNNITALHITVREYPLSSGCEGYSTLSGSWPGQLTVLKGQSHMICGVNIQGYIDRFNAVKRIDAMQNQSYCRTAFMKAQENLRLDPSITTQYLALCNLYDCS